MLLFKKSLTALQVLWVFSIPIYDGYLKRSLPISLRPVFASDSTVTDKMSDKEKLLSYFDSVSPVFDIYACPESLSPLRQKTRIYGKVIESYFINTQFGTKYKVLPNYYDFTIKSEVDRPIWDLTSSERVGQKFFQIPLISFVYERGYRENFKNFGFPGIEKEFEEADQFFRSLNATNTIMDLSCASGFMTRKFVKSARYSIFEIMK